MPLALLSVMSADSLSPKFVAPFRAPLEIKSKIPEIRARSSMSTSEVGRTAIALTLGQLSSSLEGKPEQSEILQLTKELSNDVCLDVRQAASSQMDIIVRSQSKSTIPGIRFTFDTNLVQTHHGYRTVTPECCQYKLFELALI